MPKEKLLRIIERFSFTVLAACAALLLGCGAETEGGEDTQQVQSPLLTVPGPFYNQPPQHGFCSVNSPAVAGALCHGGYSFNSGGGLPTFLRRGTGLYRVTFPSLAHGGNVQATAVHSSAHCSVATTFPQAAGVGVDLMCRNPAGAQVDVGFMVSYYREPNIGGVLGSYALVQASTPPTVTESWNSTGGAITVTQLGLGLTRVAFQNQVFGADTAIVTAFTTSAVHCKLGSWGAIAGGVAVDVRCFTFAGQPTSASFSIFYGRNVRGDARNNSFNGTQGAFSLVGAAGGIDPSRSRNTCAAGSNTAVLQAGNLYSEIYHAIGASQAERPVTAYTSAVGTTGIYCNPDMPPIQGVRSDSRVNVRCYVPDGSATTTSQHTTLFMMQDQPGGC